MAAPNKKLLGNTIAREQFLLNEARIMARLRIEGMSADEAAHKVKEENLFRYPTERSLGRITLACNRRLDALEDERLVRIIAYGMPDAAAQTNLYAMMQFYPLVRHFMTTEIARRYAELDYEFGTTDMNAYFTRLASEFDNFACMSESTITKLKQVLRKCLKEAGILGQEDRLMPVILDMELEDVLRERGDVEALRAFGLREEI